MSWLAGSILTLPPGLDARPLVLADLEATVAMVNACELHDSGEVMLERADLLSEPQINTFDAEHDWVGVFEEGRIVGWGLVEPRRTAWADVHPTARDRGIGTWLRKWIEKRAREIGADRIGQTIDDRLTAVSRMFRNAGYTPRKTSWILRMEHPDRPSAPTAPDGIELRAFQSSDEAEVLAMFEESFSEWRDRLPTDPVTWRAMVTQREGFQPEDLVLAVTEGRIVGAAFLIGAEEIWVDKLAVDRRFRRRGIGRALLQTAFVRSFDRGYGWTSLSTDSNTGALSLYERIGMNVQRSFTHHALDL